MTRSGLIFVPVAIALAFAQCTPSQLPLGRQPPGAAGTLAEPAGIGPRVVMVDQHHRMLAAIRRHHAADPGMTPGAAIRVDQAVALPGRKIDIRNRMARRFDERRVVGVGDRGDMRSDIVT